MRICNKLGITLSPTSKLRLLDECGTEGRRSTVEKLKDCELCSLVGDNLNFRIKTKHQRSDHKIQDCHYFAVLMIFARRTDIFQELSTVKPVCNPEILPLEHFILKPAEKTCLLESYKILLGRVLSKNIVSLRWLDSILPKHIPHNFSDLMSQKTEVRNLKLSFKNEAKYEDCVKILEESEDALIHQYQQARGKIKYV